MSTAHASSPVATGDLSATPFGHLALYLYRKASSGTLVLSDGAGHDSGVQAMVRFHEGRACAARLAAPFPDLLSALLPLCAWASGSYAFYEADLMQAETGASKGEIDPYVLLSRSISEHVRNDVVDAVLSHIGSGLLRIEPGRDLKRLSLSQEDAVLVDLIRAAPASIAELCEQSPLGARRTRRLLYVLIATHMVTPYRDRKNSPLFASQVRSQSFRPPTSPASLQPPHAGEGTMSISAGASRVPAWRSLASLRPSMMNASGAPSITKASGAPSMPAGASIPAVRMPLMSATERPDLATGGAGDRLRRIDKHCERAEYEAALALADELMAEDDGSADALAARAYVIFKQHAQDEDGLPREAADCLRTALSIDPDNARAVLTKGLVYKAGGDLKKALGYFRRACQLDRRNLEAQRELRLARMRLDR